MMQPKSFKKLRTKEGNYTKEKYVNTAKEGFTSSPFNRKPCHKCKRCYWTVNNEIHHCRHYLVQECLMLPVMTCVMRSRKLKATGST